MSGSHLAPSIGGRSARADREDERARSAAPAAPGFEPLQKAIGNRALARLLQGRRARPPVFTRARSAHVLQRDPILRFSDGWRPDMDLATASIAEIQEAVVHLWNPGTESFGNDMTGEIATELLSSEFIDVRTGLRKQGHFLLLNALRDVTGEAPVAPEADEDRDAWIAALTFEQATTQKFRDDHVAAAPSVEQAVAEARAKRGKKPVSTLLVLSGPARAALTAEVQQLNQAIAQHGERDIRARYRLTQARVDYASAHADGRGVHGTTRLWYTLAPDDDAGYGWAMHHLEALHEATETAAAAAEPAVVL